MDRQRDSNAAKSGGRGGMATLGAEVRRSLASAALLHCAMQSSLHWPLRICGYPGRARLNRLRDANARPLQAFLRAAAEN